MEVEVHCNDSEQLGKFELRQPICHNAALYMPEADTRVECASCTYCHHNKPLATD